MNLELKPIFNALKTKKLGPLLIALQIAITLLVVVNALFIIDGRIAKMSMPVGIDSDSIFNLNVIALSDHENHADMIKEDLRQIRALPTVMNAISPLNYFQSGSTRFEFFRTKPENVRGISTFTNVNYTDENGLSALGVELQKGRFFRADEVTYISDKFEGFPNSVVVTEFLATNLFPDGGALGGSIYVNESTQLTIIGIISDIATGWLAKDSDFLADTKYNVMLFPYITYINGANYLVRTEDGELESTIPAVERLLLTINSNRIIRRIETQEEVLEGSFSDDFATLVILLVVIMLMLVITSLGIVGLAGYSVKQRTRQIGVRRALGAKKRDIVRYFVTENLMLTSFGVAIGIIFTFVVNYVLTANFGGSRLELGYLFIGIAIVYSIGLFAVFWPARKAAAVSPAIATRTV